MRALAPVFLAFLFGCSAPIEGPEPAEVPSDPAPEATPPVGSWVPADYDPSLAVRAMFLGDSITAGAGASHGGLAYRELLLHNDAEAWPSYEGEDLARLAPDLVDTFNVSHGGATTSIMVRDQLENLQEAVGQTVSGPSLAVLTAGGNDMQLALATYLAQGPEAAGERVDLLLDNLDITIDTLRDPGRFPDGTLVYLANVYEPTDGVGSVEGCFGGLELSEMLEVLAEANLQIRALAQERGVAMIDLRQHFLGHGFYAEDETSPAYDADDPTRWLEDDCIHPNDRGHHELRRLFFGAMQGEPLPVE